MGEKKRTMTLTQLKVAKTSLGFLDEEKTLAGHQTKCRRQGQGQRLQKARKPERAGKGWNLARWLGPSQSWEHGSNSTGQVWRAQQWPHQTGLIYQVIEDG